MSSLCLCVHVRTRPAALLLCCKSVSNRYFKPVRLRFSTKGDPITASFFSEEPLLKLSRVLAAGTRRHATRGQIILFLGSDYLPRRGRQTEQTQDQTRFAWTLYKVLRGCRGEHIRDAARRYSTSRPVIRSDSASRRAGDKNQLISLI